jgi:hypothetical protein
MTEIATRPRRPVLLDLPPKTIEEVDRLTDIETIRRLVVQLNGMAEPAV